MKNKQKTKNSEIEFKDLDKHFIAKETANLIISKEFDEVLRFSNIKKGFYGILSTKLLGSYTINVASRLNKAFQRNSWKYADMVNSFLIKNISQVTKICHFSVSEWQSHIDKNISAKQSRKEFKINFHNALSFKLQEQGKCYKNDF